MLTQGKGNSDEGHRWTESILNGGWSSHFAVIDHRAGDTLVKRYVTVANQHHSDTFRLLQRASARVLLPQVARFALSDEFDAVFNTTHALQQLRVLYPSTNTSKPVFVLVAGAVQNNNPVDSIPIRALRRFAGCTMTDVGAYAQDAISHPELDDEQLEKTITKLHDRFEEGKLAAKVIKAAEVVMTDSFGVYPILTEPLPLYTAEQMLLRSSNRCDSRNRSPYL